MKRQSSSSRRYLLAARGSGGARDWMSVCCAIVFTATCVAAYTSSANGAVPKPNFIVILTDDQGWGTTSVAMDPKVPESRSDYFQMPNIERLAAQGMRFTQAYAAAPNCSPSRAALLTGRSPAALHLTDIVERNGGPNYVGNRLLPPRHVSALSSDDQTTPELLKAFDASYRTAHLGKWHLERVLNFQELVAVKSLASMMQAKAMKCRPASVVGSRS